MDYLEKQPQFDINMGFEDMDFDELNALFEESGDLFDGKKDSSIFNTESDFVDEFLNLGNDVTPKHGIYIGPKATILPQVNNNQ